jgi:hypothetical protein
MLSCIPANQVKTFREFPQNNANSEFLVREQTIPTVRPPLVGEF